MSFEYVEGYAFTILNRLSITTDDIAVGAIKPYDFALVL